MKWFSSSMSYLQSAKATEAATSLAIKSSIDSSRWVIRASKRPTKSPLKPSKSIGV